MQLLRRRCIAWSVSISCRRSPIMMFQISHKEINTPLTPPIKLLVWYSRNEIGIQVTVCQVTGINTREVKLFLNFTISRSSRDDNNDNDDGRFDRCGTLSKLKRYKTPKECFRNKIKNYKSIYRQSSQKPLSYTTGVKSCKSWVGTSILRSRNSFE